jgi:hypothetical protein
MTTITIPLARYRRLCQLVRVLRMMHRIPTDRGPRLAKWQRRHATLKGAKP